MDNSFPKGIRSALGAISAAVVFIGLGVSLSGCPVAADLENEGRFPAIHQSGSGNTAGSGAVDCNQPLPDGPGTPEIGCDYQAFMRSHCARGGCHNQATHSGDLDMTLDSLLIARIVDVPATHKITCVGIGQCDLTAPQCAGCMMCPQGPTPKLLVSKADPPSSWMMQKMERFNFDATSSSVDIGCGYAMPYPPGGTGFTAERRTCLTNFFTWVANNGRKCDLPSGGSGGAGAGGAGSGGAGSGGGGAGGT